MVDNVGMQTVVGGLHAQSRTGPEWIEDRFEPSQDLARSVLSIGGGELEQMEAIAPVYPETFFTVIEERDIRHWFRRKMPSEARNLRIIRGNPARLSFPLDSYDLVGCQFLLTLPLDPDPIIGEAIRVCAPGGTVLLQDLAGPSTEPWFAAAQSDPVLAEIDKVLRELQTVLFFGSMLNGTMEKYGMENLKVSVQSCPSGDDWNNSIERRLWTHKLHKVVPIALTRIDDDRSTEELIEAFLEKIDPEDAPSQSVMCSVTGQKPFSEVSTEPDNMG